jgi:DNA-binding transcriptional MocR family regulator
MPSLRYAPYMALADTLQRFIEQGTFRAGDKVPSVRQMATQRKVSTTTVAKAYLLLENRGQIEARPQSGFYVRPRSHLEASEPRVTPPMMEASYVGVSDLGARVMTLSADPSYIPFGSGHPDSSLFPNRKLARLLGSIVRNEPTLISRNALNWGYEPLTREIARRFLQVGAGFSHNEVVVTLGCTEALNLSLRVITKPGDTVAIESPAFFGFLQIIQSLGLKALEIPTDPRTGIDLDALRSVFAQKAVKAVMVMPTFQHPLGLCMTDERKAQLYQLLEEFDLPAIEDDVYGDLPFDDQRPKPLKAWDTSGRVLLCSSFGKTLAPGLRVGWCVPGRYLEPLRRLKLANTMGTPVALQKTIREFLRTGGYDHHLRTVRRYYLRQLELYSHTIEQSFPAGTRLSRPQGGFILWIELPARIDGQRLHAEAIKRWINFAPGSLFSVRDRYRNCIRINGSIPWSDKIKIALQRLGELAGALNGNANETKKKTRW